jgi:hypothetical protein
MKTSGRGGNEAPESGVAFSTRLRRRREPGELWAVIESLKTG